MQLTFRLFGVPVLTIERSPDPVYYEEPERAAAFDFPVGFYVPPLPDPLDPYED